MKITKYDTSGKQIHCKHLTKDEADKIIASNDARDRKYEQSVFFSKTFYFGKTSIVRELVHLLNNIVLSELDQSTIDKVDMLHTHGEALNYNMLTDLRKCLYRGLKSTKGA